MPGRLRGYGLFLARCCNQALTLRLFSFELAYSANALAFLSCQSLRGFLVEAPTLHLTEHPFPLHLPLQYFEGLIDIVVTYEYLQNLSPDSFELLRVRLVQVLRRCAIPARSFIPS